MLQHHTTSKTKITFLSFTPDPHPQLHQSIAPEHSSHSSTTSNHNTMPSTLLTGANSFVSAHIIDALIAAGHKVTGTVRRASSIDEIYAARPDWKGKVDLVVVGDYAVEDSWTELFKKSSFDHVCPLRPYPTPFRTLSPPPTNRSCVVVGYDCMREN